MVITEAVFESADGEEEEEKELDSSSGSEEGDNIISSG